MWRSWRALRASATSSAAPALLPHPLADRAGHARLVGARRNDARLRHAAGDFENELGARRRRRTARARGSGSRRRRARRSRSPRNISSRLIDIHLTDVRPLEHDRQAVDGDALRQRAIARDRDQRAGIVGAVAGDIDDAAQAAIAAVLEQLLGESDRARNRGARRAAERRARDLATQAHPPIPALRSDATARRRAARARPPIRHR